MGQQSGVIQIKGRVGNMSFYKSKDGFFVRMKGGVSGNRIATDPAFARTRENLAEFGRAGKAGKLLRHTLAMAISQAKDSNMSRRLTAGMMRALKADTTSPRGLRSVADGNTAFLEGFEFNIASPLSTTLFTPFTATIDRVAGTLTVELPPFTPNSAIASPAGATHFVLQAAGAELDFVNNVSNGNIASSGDLPLNGIPTAPLTLTVPVTVNSTGSLFLTLGISFAQIVNGEHYLLNNGSYNALALVKVSHE